MICWAPPLLSHQCWSLNPYNKDKHSKPNSCVQYMCTYYNCCFCIGAALLPQASESMPKVELGDKLPKLPDSWNKAMNDFSLTVG
jgi:hypothetical protein